MQKGIGMPLIIGAVGVAALVALGAFILLGSGSSPEPPTGGEEPAMMEKDKNAGAVMEKDMGAMMEKTEPTKDAMMKDIDESMMKDMMAMSFQYSGQLADVTGGATIRGISTGGNGSGVAKASYKNGKYDLLVTFENISDPAGTDFYEGWVVRRGDDFSVISTGRVEKVDGVYTNAYSSGDDLTDHDFYVLTIEPDDGDPAPADHIVEGVMTR
jgi:hypothetical protein